MHRQSSKALAIFSRRSKVAALFLRGVTNQFEICRSLGMDDGQQSIISRDLKAIREEWRQSAVRDFDEARGNELAKLDAAEAEFWAAWQRSQVEHTSTRRKSRARQQVEGEQVGGDMLPVEDEVKKEKRDGDPRFLEGVLACIKKRCELLGLDAPERSELTGKDGEPIKFNFSGLEENELLQFRDTLRRIRSDRGLAGGRN